MGRSLLNSRLPVLVDRIGALRGWAAAHQLSLSSGTVELQTMQASGRSGNPGGRPQLPRYQPSR
jgi:hypothetical protein